jgi:hypothetical protein
MRWRGNPGANWTALGRLETGWTVNGRIPFGYQRTAAGVVHLPPRSPWAVAAGDRERAQWAGCALTADRSGMAPFVGARRARPRGGLPWRSAWRQHTAVATDPPKTAAMTITLQRYFVLQRRLSARAAEHQVRHRLGMTTHPGWSRWSVSGFMVSRLEHRVAAGRDHEFRLRANTSPSRQHR